MHGPGSIRDRLDHVQLIRKSSPGSDSGQMLRLIDKHDRGTPVTQRLLRGVTQFRIAGNSVSTYAGVRGAAARFRIDKGFVHCKKKATEIISPAKPPAVRRRNIDADEGKAAGIGCHLNRYLLQEEMLDFKSKRGLPDTRRPEHQHQRARRRALNRVHQFVARRHQARVCHGESAESLNAPAHSVVRHQSSPYVTKAEGGSIGMSGSASPTSDAGISVATGATVRAGPA